MKLDWTAQLVGQLEFYWTVHLRPRLEGLTDDEYFWEPVPGCWSIRRDDHGRWRMDTQRPEDRPVTTIAWRMAHISVGIFGTRASAFFGPPARERRPSGLASDRGGREAEARRDAAMQLWDVSVPDDADMFDPRHEPESMPGTADEGIALLESTYRWWHDGIAALDEAGLAKPLGPKGNMFADDPMAALILHLNRETMHHGGEICLLRDLYAHMRV